LRLAARQFESAVQSDPHLKVLLLVDPLQAFADAGVTLSKPARRLIRRTHPDLAYGNRELYDAVRQGRVRLEWVQRVTLGRPLPVSDSEDIEVTGAGVKT
jgi:hypothetical protein